VFDKGAAMRDDKPASFFTRLTQAWRPLQADDPADYGTAFGLELSMEAGIPHEPAPSSEPAADEGWFARWRGRPPVTPRSA
jgi:hypothetical protein